ncbi:FKBP-type peptidyl-prolyl cis-trans isomerase [Streptomyces sp. NPDC059985]|uniref:FKBP-type peptidyl-prolyl cis-trans isomerase n=1 Tax=Streptomyces sp. NPDC059985 TaxID=3347025 RepID=UPI0036B9BFC3
MLGTKQQLVLMGHFARCWTGSCRSSGALPARSITGSSGSRKEKMRRLLILLLVCATSLTGCSEADPVATSASPAGLPAITSGAPFGEKPSLARGVGQPPTALKVAVIHAGDGASVRQGDEVEVNYLGQMWDATRPFDNSFDRGQPFKFVLGKGQVIEGWEQGLQGQTAGSRIEMSVPPSLAYGKQGQGEIKPNATLIFVVDILESTAR